MIIQPRNQTGRTIGIILVVLLVIGLLVAVIKSRGTASANTAATTPKAATSTPTTTTQIPKDTSAPDDAISAQYAAIRTGLGSIVVELYPDSAPKTVANFATLAKRGYYNNLTFHRVVKDFVIQGGDPNGDGSGGESIYGPTFNDEINAVSLGLSSDLINQYQQRGYVYRTDITSHKMEVGSIAMANRGPNTNGSQFFIVTGVIPAPGLDGRHTVFGKVVSGMDVVMKINAVETNGTQMDHPKDVITITTIVPGDTPDQVTKATP